MIIIRNFFLFKELKGIVVRWLEETKNCWRVWTNQPPNPTPLCKLSRLLRVWYHVHLAGKNKFYQYNVLMIQLITLYGFVMFIGPTAGHTATVWVKRKVTCVTLSPRRPCSTWYQHWTRPSSPTTISVTQKAKSFRKSQACRFDSTILFCNFNFFNHTVFFILSF